METIVRRCGFAVWRSCTAAIHSVIPDRIEAGTFLVAGAITGGDLTITNCAPAHLGAVIAKLEKAGVVVETPDATTLRVRERESWLRRT